MVFIRKIKKGNSTYLAKVESYRKDGKVKQRVLEYLGKEENGVAVKRVFSSEVEVTQVKRFLDGHVLHQIALELGLPDMLGDFSKEILLITYGHLLNKRSLSRLSDWISKTDFLDAVGLKEINTKRLFEAIGSIENVDFATIEKLLRKKWKTIDKDNDYVVFDVTDTYFNGSHANWKSRKGKDGQIEKLVQVALAVTFQHGLPCMHKMYEGNIGNTKIFMDMLSSLGSSAYKGVILDRGMHSKENIQEMNALKMKSILGIRQTPDVRKHFLDKIQRDEIYTPKHRIELKETTVYANSFDYESGKLIVIYNPALELSKREQLFAKNKDAEITELKYLGYSLIYHNTTYDISTTIKKYFEKDVIEKAFRSMKGILQLRPIRFYLLNHVESHIKICYLAYVLLAYMEYKLRKKNIQATQALEELSEIYKVELKNSKSNHSWSKVVTLKKNQQQILHALDVVYKN